jgi:hypothetical protein
MSIEITPSMREKAAVGEKMSVEDWSIQAHEWSPEMITLASILITEFQDKPEEGVAKTFTVLEGAGKRQDVQSLIAISLLSSEAKGRLKSALAANELLEYMSRARRTDDFYDPYDSEYGSEGMEGDWDEDETDL